MSWESSVPIACMNCGGEIPAKSRWTRNGPDFRCAECSAAGFSPRLKRALWCRWFHRWHMPRYPAPAVTSRDPAGSASFTLSAGPHRSCCDACLDFDYGRAHRRWLAS